MLFVDGLAGCWHVSGHVICQDITAMCDCPGVVSRLLCHMKLPQGALWLKVQQCLGVVVCVGSSEVMVTMGLGDSASSLAAAKSVHSLSVLPL